MIQLEHNPDEEFDLQDEQAKILLFDLGIVDRLKVKDYGRIIMQAVVFNEHPTHHILALHHSGHSDSKENGYQALCFPKSKVSLEAFRQVAVRFIGSSPEPPLETQFFGGPPKNN
jgi:hypothetical protein